MKLTTRCTSCGIDMYMNTWHSTRSELQMKKGDHLEFNCKHCETHQSKHINDLSAVQSNKIKIFAFLISVLIGVAMLFIFEGHFLWFSGLVFIIPLYSWSDQMQKTKAFNSYMVRRK